ncbi:alpha-1,3-glucanase/mutanase [Aspergillus terreus]|uniref:Alpha-1,3-glucanase/mutanase n=1 Tax=Aspergillus terreus TaxID=33178 RepID=A0A5M3YKY7_ASPTE|nr:hypothetical protein ATETN484_0001011000 [Aspergillus terreus]GFF11891.1 alpha-1,3-glucanase/mutanase [Aspergillus terreus]
MKPLHSLWIFPLLITHALSLSPVAVPNIYSSAEENRTFNYDVIQAFARLNGTWTPEIRSFTTLEDLASIPSKPSTSSSNATHSSTYMNRRSHNVHRASPRRHHHRGSSLDHRSSHSKSGALVTRAEEPKAVFAHFMLENAEDWNLGAWEDEIKLARAAHIDGFVLNFGSGVDYGTPFLKAYVAAQELDFRFFFSFDYAGNGPFEIDTVIQTLKGWASLDMYYQFRGKPLVSTFEGPANAADWTEIKAAFDCFFMPDWSSLGAKDALALQTADGLSNWAAWPWGNTDMDTYVDASYLDFLERDGGKPYMMPVSPWFYTNLPGYHKNWLWRGDDLWRDRWEEVMVVQPDLVQIISWNDFGESHYIGPLPKDDYKAFEVGKAPYDYITGMPHDAWRQLLPIGLTPTKRAKHPSQKSWSWAAQQLQIEFDPAEVAQDIIVFSAVLTSDATISVTVGGVALPAQWKNKPSGGVGVYHGSVAYGGHRGAVKIAISRAGQTIASFTGTEITTSCPDGYTNWNAWVGSATGPKLASAVSPKLAIDEQQCIRGTAKGNFKGLWEFTCSYGYCPIGACVCLELGPPKRAPRAHGGERVDLTEPTVSPFLPSACTSGTGQDSYIGFCQYACDFGFCPIKHCTCTSTGTLIPPPAQGSDYDGEWALDGDDSGLCSFACSRGYCPDTACREFRPNEVIMCNDGSEDPECLANALADSEACDLSLTFDSMADLENSLATIPSGCTGIYAMQVLLKLLKDTKANYTAVDNNYDYWFYYYIKYMHRVVPQQIWNFVSWGDKGPGNKYFDCTLINGEPHEPETCPIFPTGMSYHIDYDFNDEKGFWGAVAERGIQKDWISFEDWDIPTYCPPPGPTRPPGCLDGTIVLEDYPHPADNMTFANPKDIISKSHGKFDQLELDIATTWTEMMFGFWDGDYDDAVEAVSVPVFMLAQAVESMEQVKQLGQEEKEYEETELIMKIVTAVLFVVPFAGEIAGEVAGLAWLVEAAVVVDLIGNTVMGVYDAVKNKGSPAMVVLDLLLGATGRRTGKNYSNAAAKRREMGADGVSGFGDVFKRHDDALRRVIPVDRCKA